MKKILHISLISLLFVFLSILTILGLVFIFIEGRFLFSGEWIVYQNQFNIFVRILFKLLLALICISMLVLEIVNLRKKNIYLTHALFGVNIGLCVMGIIMFIQTANYIDIVALILPIVILCIKTVLLFVFNTYKK